MMVSLRVSPFVVEVAFASLKPITRPPSRLIAVSKLSRVRVDGSKKRLAMTLSRKRGWFGLASKSAANSMMRNISSLLKSLIDTKLLFFIV